MGKWYVRLTEKYGGIKIEADSWEENVDGGLTFWRGEKEFSVISPGRWIYVIEDLSQ